MKTTILLTMLMLAGCSGADFNVGATRGDTGDDDAEETSDDTGAVSADAEVGADAPDAPDAPDALPTDTGKPDTGIAPDTGVGTDTGLDIGTDTGSPDTGTPPIDSGADVLVDGACPDLDGDGQTDARCGGTDCHDGNKDVFLGQISLFSSPYTTISGGSSWDYNCNGKADLWTSSAFSCTGACVYSGLWIDGVPPCGATGKWLSTCTGSCVITTSTKKQLCN